MKKFLAVHFHVFYDEFLEYYLDKLNNLSHIDCDVFVTMVSDNLKIRRVVQEIFKNAKFFIVPNRGYDIGAFFFFLNKINFLDYKYILKIHTKNLNKKNILKIHTKSLDKKGNIIISSKKLLTKDWVSGLITPMLGSKQFVDDTFKFLEDNLNVTMVSGIISSDYCHYIDLLSKINANLFNLIHEQVNIFRFVPGTMFIARSFIFYKLSHLYSIKDFEITSLSTRDGTLAHVLERGFGIIADYYGNLKQINRR
ncbi:MAG: rhamnan synthesis F family protein [Alphaproteobacteria bacterium]|nr:rhamnan synthesis F family protein [Alphaproteobacteria bacterium]